MKKILLMLSSLFVLYACSNLEEKNIGDITSPSKNIDEDTDEHVNSVDKNGENPEIITEIEFKRYFKPADSTATFIGDGNEFASFTEKTTWLAENYVATIINNGGAVTMKVYRVDENKIDLVMDELVDGMPEDSVFPTIETLDGLSALETFLSGPIKVGTTFENWTIVETDIELVTPYQTFEHVFVIEESGEGFTNKKYIVTDYGVIKTEAIMTADSSEEVIVTSTLEDISLH